MFARLRSSFGVPGLIAVAALVFAMIGGAYAASDQSGGKATASAKGKQGKRGPRGPKGATGAAGAAGAQGPAGPAGPAGPVGPAGPAGPAGAAGDNGTPGAPGTSVTVDPIAVGISACDEQGGAKVKEDKVGGDSVDVCNGARGEDGDPGPPGPKGDPWTELGVLPEGETLTGTWAFTASDADTEILVPLSFPIKLPSELSEEADDLHFTGGETTDCPGNYALPTAAPGKLCVYFNPFGGEIINATFGGIFKTGEPISGFSEEGAHPAGAIVQFLFDGEAGELASGAGTWAVTAPLAGP